MTRGVSGVAGADVDDWMRRPVGMGGRERTRPPPSPRPPGERAPNACRPPSLLMLPLPLPLLSLSPPLSLSQPQPLGFLQFMRSRKRRQERRRRQRRKPPRDRPPPPDGMGPPPRPKRKDGSHPPQRPGRARRPPGRPRPTAGVATGRCRLRRCRGGCLRRWRRWRCRRRGARQGGWWRELGRCRRIHGANARVARLLLAGDNFLCMAISPGAQRERRMLRGAGWSLKG